MFTSDITVQSRKNTATKGERPIVQALDVNGENDRKQVFIWFECIKLLVTDMTEIFSSLFGQNETQGPAGSSSLGFGPGKPPPPLPQNQVSVAGQMPPQLGDEGPALRKPGAMNEPFYLLRELPGTDPLELLVLSCILFVLASVVKVKLMCYRRAVCKQC